MKYVLIGPPGIGKSTLIKELRGIDLENYPASRRVRMLRTSIAKYYGAADVNPNVYDDETICWVFLQMPVEQYRERRKNRDAQQPGKGSQPEMGMFTPSGLNWRVVDASGSVREVADRIRQL